MNVDPYRAVNGVSFGWDESAVVACLGKPARRRISDSRTVLEYNSTAPSNREILVFVSEEGVCEILSEPPTVEIGNLVVDFKNLPAFLHATDEGTFELAGFVVSPKYGLSVCLDEPSVSAFSESVLSGWRALAVRAG